MNQPDQPPASASPPTKRPREPWRLLCALAWLAAVGAAAALLFGHLWPPALQETSRLYVLISFAAFLVLTFQFQMGLALLPVAAFAAAGRRKRLLLLTLPLLAVTLGPAAWSYRPRSAPQVEAGADTLTIMSANLLYSRADIDILAAQIAAAEPDVILFQEYSSRDRARLAPILGERYPHRATVERDDAFGQAVYSKRPFLAPPRHYLQGRVWTEPQITVDIDLGGEPVRITNIHLMSPVGIGRVTQHRLQAAGLAEHIRAELAAGHDLILAGDFNATPGSHHLRAIERAGVREAHGAVGRGRGVTWCRTTTLAYFPGIRLDHLFTSEGIVPLGASTGDDTGSDHLPVIGRVVRRRD